MKPKRQEDDIRKCRHQLALPLKKGKELTGKNGLVQKIARRD
jgi:hypothetical protein